MPQLLRCPLSRAVLQAKMLNMGDPKSLLGLAMDPPDLSNIENTVLLLKEVSVIICFELHNYAICNCIRILLNIRN